MMLINLVGIETRSGYRTIELHHCDITKLDFPVDVIVFSAFSHDYIPTPNTVIRALKESHGIDVAQEALCPEYDLRTALGFWVSHPLKQPLPFGRLACIEILGNKTTIEEALDNVFAGLLLLEAKRLHLPTVALPLLGTGAQQLPEKEIASLLVVRAREYLERSDTTDRLIFVEIDPEKAKLVSEALDNQLGRMRVTLPQQDLVDALRNDVCNRLQNPSSLFLPGSPQLRKDWLSLLEHHEVRSVEFGVCARRLVELLVSRLGARPGNLASRIYDLERGGTVAPWVCGYMNILRHLGNEAVHETQAASIRIPSVISGADLIAGLFCILRLFDFWDEFAKKNTLNT